MSILTFTLATLAVAAAGIVAAATPNTEAHPAPDHPKCRTRAPALSFFLRRPPILIG